jgi:hypothetical protein
MFGLVAVIAAIAMALGAFNSARADGDGVFGQSLPIAYDAPAFVDNDGTCDFGPYTSGDEVWHFVVKGRDSFVSLVATFEGDIKVDGELGPQAGGEKHMYVLAPGGLDLIAVSAVTDPAGAVFVLSHICPPGQEPPEDILSVSKTADTSFTRTHKWSIDKKVETENEFEHNDLPKIWLYTDGSGDESATWTVDVTYDGYDDSAFVIYGDITISNPAGNKGTVTINSVVDDLGLAEYNDITLVCKDADNTVIDPVGYPLGLEETITCTYSVSFGNTKPADDGTNTVTVAWTDSLGEPQIPVVETDGWEFGDPTTEINKTVNVEDISNLFGTVDLGSVTAPNGDSFDYDKPFAWADYGAAGCDDYQYDNTATIVETGASASATLLVNVQCFVYETAYAKGDGTTSDPQADETRCFIQDGFSQWGWTNKIPSGDETYTWELWAAAGQCDTGKGTLVGTVTVTRTNGTVNVVFNVADGYDLQNTHVYVGTNEYPVVRGKKTVAPGQYTNPGGFNGSAVWVIAHAVVGIPDPNFGP